MSLEQYNKIKKHLKMKEAMEAMINKNYEKALELFTVAINFDTNDWKIYIQRCNCLQKLNRLEDALKDAQIAVDLNPTQMSCHFRKGCVLLDQKMFRSAEKSFKTALECSPEDENCRLKLKETFKSFIEEFGIRGQNAEILAEKYKSCADISDALIDGKLLTRLDSGSESMISSESPRHQTEGSIAKTIDSNNGSISSMNGSLPDFNEMESTIESVNNLSLNEGDIRKPSTIPIFNRKSLTPKTDSSPAVALHEVDTTAEETLTPPSKSRMVKTRPQILRSIKT